MEKICQVNEFKDIICRENNRRTVLNEGVPIICTILSFVHPLAGSTCSILYHGTKLGNDLRKNYYSIWYSVAYFSQASVYPAPLKILNLEVILKFLSTKLPVKHLLNKQSADVKKDAYWQENQLLSWFIDDTIYTVKWKDRWFEYITIFKMNCWLKSPYVMLIK